MYVLPECCCALSPFVGGATYAAIGPVLGMEPGGKPPKAYSRSCWLSTAKGSTLEPRNSYTYRFNSSSTPAVGGWEAPGGGKGPWSAGTLAPLVGI